MAKLTLKFASLALAVMVPSVSAIDILLCDDAYFNDCAWKYNVPTGECLNSGAAAGWNGFHNDAVSSQVSFSLGLYYVLTVDTDTVRQTLGLAANATTLPMMIATARCSTTATMNRTGWVEIMTGFRRSSALRVPKLRGQCQVYLRHLYRLNIDHRMHHATYSFGLVFVIG